MHKGTQKLSKRISFRWKLMLSYLLILALAMGTSFGSLLMVSNEHQRHQARSLFDHAMETALSQAEQQLGAIESVLLLLTQDRSISRIVNVEYISNYEKALDVLNILDPIISLLHTNYKEFKSYAVHTNGSIADSRKNFIPLSEAADRWVLYDGALAIEPTWNLEPPSEEWTSGTLLSVASRSVYMGTLEESAVVVLFVDAAELLRDIMPSNGMPMALSVTDARGERIFSAGSVVGEGDYVFTQQRQVEHTDWVLQLTMDASGMMMSIPQVMQMPLYILLAVLIASIVVSAILTHGLTMRIKQLRAQIKQVVPASFQLDISDDTHDEIGDIANSVGEMIQETRSVLLQRYQERIARREAQIIALQAQINPHFLFNVMSNLNWRVIKMGDREMSGIITKLSKFYYMSISDGKQMSSVRGEMNHLEMYLQIQFAIRGQQFEVVREIDEEVLGTPMPGVILQPLVENAIEHGVNAVGFEKGVLRITAAREGDNVCITIADNGPGIQPEVIENLRTDAVMGYGLRNVDRRLRLYYGEEHGLRFSVPDGGGTCIGVLIPKGE